MLKNKMRFKKVLLSENTESGALTATIIAAILAINVIIYVIVSTFSLYFTSSSKDMIVLSGNTDYLFEEAIDEGKKVKISFCYPTKEELEAHSTGAFVHKTAEEYAKRYPDFIEIEYYEQLYTNKLGNQGVVDNFLETYNPPRVNHEEVKV